MSFLVVMNDPNELSSEDLHFTNDIEKTEGKLKLKGTSSEALDTVEATINRLNKLSATIRRYSTTSLESRFRDPAQKHEDEKFTTLAKKIVSFKYVTANASLQEQLVASMLHRRQRLRYIGKHQAKLANRQQKKENEQPNNRPDVKRHVLLASEVHEAARENAPTRSPNHKRVNNVVVKNGAPSETEATTFKPTMSIIGRLKREEASVVSSSKDSKTFMIEGLETYPEVPKKHPGKPEPTCVFCYRPLQDRDLTIRRWRYDRGTAGEELC